MKLSANLVSALLLTMTLMFSGEAALAKKSPGKKKHHSSMTLSLKQKKAKKIKTHSSKTAKKFKKTKRSAGYAKAAKYMAKRKPAMAKKHRR